MSTPTSPETPPPAESPPDTSRRRHSARAGLLLAVLLVGVLSLAALLSVLPPRMLMGAIERLDDRLVEYDLHVARISVNPFTLRVTLHEVSARAVRGAGRFESSRIRLNLSLATLFRRTLVLSALVIDQPRGAIEWSVAPEHGPAVALGPRLAALLGWLAPMQTRQLLLQDGEFELIGAPPDGANIRLEGFSLQASNITPHTPVSYAVHVAHLQVGEFGGATVSVAGSLSADAASTDGWLAVDGLDLRVLARAGLWQQWIESAAPDGHLHAMAAYRWSAGVTATRIEVLQGIARVRALEMTPREGLRVRAPDVQAEFSAAMAAGAVVADLALASAHAQLLGLQREPLWFSSVSATVRARRDRTDANDQAPAMEVRLQGQLVDGGGASMSMRFDTLPAQAPAALALQVEDMQASALADYSGRALGHSLVEGRVDLGLDATRTQTWLEGELQVVADGLVWANGDGPVEVATALLQDRRGQLQLELLLDHRIDPHEDIASVVGRALHQKLAGMAAEPFTVLSRLADHRPLGAVHFEPGSASPLQTSLDSLQALNYALQQRPNLGIAIPATVDLAADRRALAVRQVELHVSLDTADPARLRPGAVDFSSPRAQDILDEFAGERLDVDTLARIRIRSDTAEARDPGDRVPYYRALFEALVQAEQISELALTRLARFRAQAVAETLAGHGLARARIATGAEPVAVDSARRSRVVTAQLEVLPLANGTVASSGEAGGQGAMDPPAPEPLEGPLPEPVQPQPAQQQLQQEQADGKSHYPGE